MNELSSASGLPSSRGERDAQLSAAILMGSILLTVLLFYVIPYGRTIGYPLILLSTLAHEMGHGIAAICVGGSFERFVIYPDGSGVATWSGNVGRIGQAIVSAGGLVGPAIVAAIGFVLARKPDHAPKALYGFGFLLFLSLILVVRNIFGFFFVSLTAAACWFAASKLQPRFCQFFLSFIASQLALSVFSRGDYLFTAEAHTARGVMPSDVAQMADALFLPYWFWGGLCGLFSVLVLLWGLKVSLAPSKS